MNTHLLSSTIQTYADSISVFTLSPSQVSDLVNELYLHKRQTIFELVRAHLLTVVEIASTYAHRGPSLAALIKAGNLALIQAVYDYYPQHTEQEFFSYLNDRLIQTFENFFLQQSAYDICTNCGQALHYSHRYCTFCGQPHQSSAQPDIVECSHCQQKIYDYYQFCPQCGSSFQKEPLFTCSNCQQSIDCNDLFCPSCGYLFFNSSQDLPPMQVESVNDDDDNNNDDSNDDANENDQTYHSSTSSSSYVTENSDDYNDDPAYYSSTSSSSYAMDEKWGKIREKVFAQKGHFCQECGSTINLHIHHIKPRHLGGTDDLGNLTILCRDCHEKLHGHTINGDNQNQHSVSQKATILNQAIKKNLLVEFDYVDRDKKRTHRAVLPYEVMYGRPSEFDKKFANERPFSRHVDTPRQYFHGFCHLDQEERTFRLSRMSNLKLKTKS